MSFRCQFCNTSVGNTDKHGMVVVAKPVKIAQYREVTYSDGSKGTEIAKEKLACPKCAKLAKVRSWMNLKNKPVIHAPRPVEFEVERYAEAA